MQESEGVLCMRVSFRIALAGQVIGVSALYEQTRTFCKNYLTDAYANHSAAVRQYNQNIGQGSVCGTRPALDDIRSCPASRGRGAGVPHPDTGAASAHAGRICRTGQPARTAQQLVSRTAGDIAMFSFLFAKQNTSVLFQKTLIQLTDKYPSTNFTMTQTFSLTFFKNPVSNGCIL